ncbi:hypothetical protein GmHk_U059449 [Glycine max]|nr:hypothetical protein GmHk_U059449 [Glycine max]
MNVNFEETQVCAYVFNPNVDPSGNEILFGVGNNLGTRQNFQSLLKTLIQHYEKDWMPSFSNLKLTCIKTKIYHLDYDLTSQTAYDRKDTIKIMAHVMLSVLETMFETQHLFFGFHRMDTWDIVEARGIPNGGSIEKSALWVLEWMQIEESFVSLLYGVLDEKAVGMKLIMILLLGTHNQYKGNLIRNAECTWHDCIHGKH